MAKPKKTKGDYCIRIDFERGSERPARVFNAMAGLIDVFQAIDADLAKSVSARIEPVLVLQEVEAGSIKTWLSSVIKSVDDEALKEGDWKKVVGTYLLKGKMQILKFLEIIWKKGPGINKILILKIYV